MNVPGRVLIVGGNSRIANSLAGMLGPQATYVVRERTKLDRDELVVSDYLCLETSAFRNVRTVINCVGISQGDAAQLHTVNVEYQNKNAELRELNEDMNHLFASTEIGTVFLDDSLNIRRFTPRIASVFDLQPQDVGRPLASFSHTLSLDNLSDLILSVLSSGEIVEREVQDKLDNHFFMRINPYRLDTSIAGVILTLTDITAMVQSRRLAEKYQDLLQKAIDAVPVFVSFVNRQERYEYANKAYRMWLEMEEGQVIGNTVRQVVGVDTYRVSKPHIDRALAGEDQEFEVQMETVKGPRILSTSYTSARNARGDVIGFYVSATDVTSLKEAEASLARAYDSARLANQAKSDFLANMSHEIRSPMTAILGFADILDEQLKNPDNRNAIDVIRKNGRHLLDIINDILDLARIESGKMELENSEFRADDLLKECHNTVIPRADQNDVRLELSIDPVLRNHICGDRRRVRQVILNLLTNAIKFSPGGRVLLAGRRDGDEMEIVVRDNGCGIPEDVLPHLFQPFCQAENSDVRRHEGTGLGLTITKQLVERMDGTIVVETEVDEGAVFTIRLPWMDGDSEPCDDDDGDSEPVPVKDRTPRLDGRQILVIDDRRDIRFIAEHILVDAGALVETAEDGQSGVESSRVRMSNETPFDCIVTDIQMPEMDGYETAQQIRSLGYSGPILALSASAMQSDRDKALAAGCDEHISKPIHRTSFIELIARLIR